MTLQTQMRRPYVIVNDDAGTIARGLELLGDYGASPSDRRRAEDAADRAEATALVLEAVAYPVATSFSTIAAVRDYALDYDPARADRLWVFLNGKYLLPDTDYSVVQVSGVPTLRLAQAPDHAGQTISYIGTRVLPYDPNLNRVEGFGSRALLVNHIAANGAVAGHTYTADGLDYITIPTGHVLYGTDPIPDLPGLMPAGDWHFGHFDIAGIGDETAKITAFFDAPNGTNLHGDAVEVNYTTFTIPARNLKFHHHGASFRRSINSSASGILIEGNFEADLLDVRSIGGAANRNVWVRGSRVKFKLKADQDTSNTVADGASVALTVQSPALLPLYDVEIDWIETEKISSPFVAQNIDLLRVNGADCKNSRTGFYLIDVRDFVLSNGQCTGLGPVNGAAGENSVLLEATTPGGTKNGLIINWLAEDTGEHGYRLGGQQTISDVTFLNCVSRRPGQAINGGDLSGGVWSGGCGFKVLGGTTVGGTRHKRITFTDCTVYDIEQTFGTYPTGHGVNNFTPYMAIAADDVVFNNCRVGKEQEAYSCRNGILFTAVSRLTLNNCDFADCELTAIKPFRETPVAGFPGQQDPFVDAIVNGGRYHVAASSGGIVVYYAEATDVANSGFVLNNPTLIGGEVAVRFETPAAGGSFARVYLDYLHYGSNGVSGVSTTPIQAGNGLLTAISNIRGDWRASPAYSAIAENGSKFTDTLTGLVYERFGGTWRQRPEIVSSGYQPTATIVSNLDSASVSFCQFTRVGSNVIISGNVTLDPTAGGSIQARITLPFASNFTASRQAGGTFMASDGATVSGSISADATNDELIFAGTATVTSARTCFFTAMYTVV